MLAIITGASGGFGAQFAWAFARRGYDLCLVARSQDKLEALKDELVREHRVAVEILVSDLASPEGLAKVVDFIKGSEVEVLVNNAGIDRFWLADEAKLDEEMRMLDLNVRAAHVLARHCLNGMIKRNKGRILTTGSLAGCFPVPWTAAYCAGKAYVAQFAEATNYELRVLKKDVRMSVLLPGPMNTGIAGDGYSVVEQGRSIPDFVEKAVRKFLAGKTVICLDPDNINRMAMRLIPRKIGNFIVYRTMRKTYLPR